CGCPTTSPRLRCRGTAPIRPTVHLGYFLHAGASWPRPSRNWGACRNVQTSSASSRTLV
ncbi:MAG: hypothetical protein AVDCRST_MAG77-3273, partial [uncultured Chloroflexi bacterium]